MLKPALRLMALLFILCSVSRAQSPDPVNVERGQAATLLVDGRLATAAEIRTFRQLENVSVAELVARRKAALREDASARRAAALRALYDALGRVATEAEGQAVAAAAATYAEDLAARITWLASHPADYRQVIDRAYQLVVSRNAFAEEYTYWEKRPALPFVLLVGAIENWAQRNAPGLMVTNGAPTVSINSRFLTTYRLSLPIANEVREILGLPIWTDVGRLQNPGCNLVAAGAEGIASLGGMHFMVVGRPEFSGH